MIQSSCPGYLWRSPSGHLVSPSSFWPPLHQVRVSHKLKTSYRYLIIYLVFSRKIDILYVQASIVLDQSDDVGLIIRGGSEFSLGIFVTGVQQNSAASKLGLRVGWYLLFSTLIFSFLGVKMNILNESQKQTSYKLQFLFTC